MALTAVLTQDPDGGYVAHNPETGTTTQGDSVPEALANLREATELYLEEHVALSRATRIAHEELNKGNTCPFNTNVWLANFHQPSPRKI